MKLSPSPPPTLNGALPGRLLIENYGSLAEYTQEKLVFETCAGFLTVTGQCLRVLAMTCREILVGERVLSVSLEEPK